VATVRDNTTASRHARTIVLDVPGWPGHRAGQHVDVRLVAEDGYQAQRSYSIASAPEDAFVSLTIERLDEGEVSPYLADVLQPGDGLEVRGPIGGYFVWDVRDGGPLLLVAGGSGVVPLLAMLRHRAHADRATQARIPVRLLYSARGWEDVIDRAELERIAATTGAEVTFTLTREVPDGWTGLRRRVDREMVASIAWPASARPLAFVCGPTPFVESVASLLVDAGYEPSWVRTERFGPTG
jgi:ferredoxin-NADP reductase